RHEDDTSRDLVAHLHNLKGEGTAAAARRFLEVSPHAPAARAALIDTDWEGVRGEAAAWEKEAVHPAVLAALARQYARARRLEDAERCVRAYLRLSPDVWMYENLAELYKAQGRLDRWEETLEASLKEEDYGLQHAWVRFKLAKFHMARRQWNKALPHA